MGILLATVWVNLAQTSFKIVRIPRLPFYSRLISDRHSTERPSFRTLLLRCVLRVYVRRRHPRIP